MIKRFFQLLAAVFLTGISFFSPLEAKVLRPIQIFFPGNFSGQAVNLDQEMKLKPAPCWKAPDLIASFHRYSRDALNMVFAVGNDSSVNEVVSFCTDGMPEQSLINKCQPTVCGVSPQDLMIHRNSVLPPIIRQKILTNLESKDDFSVFPSHFKHQEEDFSIWFFNFIGEEEFARLPMQNWSHIKPEDPSRALRRLNPEIQNEDLSITTVHMGKEKIMELANEFNRFPGYHILIDVAESEAGVKFSAIRPQRFARTFVVSIFDGIDKLPMLNIKRSNFSYPRLSQKMLAYAKVDKGRSEENFAEIKPQIGAKLFQTLTMITTSVRPTTAPFRFSPELHASFCRSQMSADLAIVLPPEENHKRDNVINPANLLPSFANEKIFTLRLTGKHLVEIVNELMRHHPGTPFFAFSGISFNFVADQARDILIGRFPIQLSRSYNLAINQNLLSDPVSAKIFASTQLEPFDGTTLWDVWKIQLKSLRINSEHLLD